MGLKQKYMEKCVDTVKISGDCHVSKYSTLKKYCIDYWYK